MSQIKVFVINLKRSNDRRDYMQKLLTPLDIQYEIFPATDGRDLKEQEYKTIRERGKNIVKKYPNRDLMNRGEIGCALSHLRVYQKIVKEKIDYACILEDDIIIKNTEDFKYCLIRENLLTLQKKQKWDFIYLYCNYFTDGEYYYWDRLLDSSNNLGMQWGRTKIKENLYLKKLAMLTFWSTTAYIINQKAAQTFLADGWPVKKLADVLTGSAEYLGLQQYIIASMPLLTPLSYNAIIKGTINHKEASKSKKSSSKKDNLLEKNNWKSYLVKLIKFPIKLFYLLIIIIPFFLRKVGIISLKKMVKKNIYYD